MTSHLITAIIQNATPIAAGIFGGYFTVSALLITLAISRHDSLIPLSRTIAGRYNIVMATVEFISFASIITASLLKFPTVIMISLVFELLSVVFTGYILVRAIDAAMSPSKYERIALKRAEQDVGYRVRKALQPYYGKPTQVSIRGKIPVESILSQDSGQIRHLARKEGVVVYRKVWLRCLEWYWSSRKLEHHTMQGNKPWLAQNQGSMVRVGDTLAVAVPWTLGSMLCVGAVRVIPLELDYWTHIFLTAKTSYFNRDFLTYERSIHLFIAAFKALSKVNSGNGVSVKDMWPQLGSDEAFRIGVEFANLVRDISLESSNKRDAGRILLKVVDLSLSRPSSIKAVCHTLELLKDEAIEFPVEDVGRLLLRQKYFPMELRIWAIMARSWFKSILVCTKVADWLHRSGVSIGSMGIGADILGAMAILSDDAAESSLCDYLNDGATKIAKELAQQR